MILTTEFKRFVLMSRFLFARKFDPEDAKSLALVDYIDTIRSDDGDRFRDMYKLDYGGSVMIAVKRPFDRHFNSREDSADASNHRSCLAEGDASSCADGNPEEEITVDSLDEYFCVEIMKSGHKLRLAKCEPVLPFQWFMIGPCTDNTDMYINDGNHLLTSALWPALQ